MKFQKGILLSDNEKRQIKAAIAKGPAGEPKPLVLGDVEKNRLFETQQEFEGSSSHYLKVLGILAVVVLIGGGIFFYVTQPGVGDQVKAPADVESAIRENFLSVQKRTATDIVVYKCDGFYWARVGVETRNDIANPIMKIDKYSARATQAGEKLWIITAQPILNPDLDVPCK